LRSEPLDAEVVEVDLPTGRCCSLRLSGKHARRSWEGKVPETVSLKGMEDVVRDAVMVAAGEAEVDVEMEERRALTNMTRVTLSASSAMPMVTMPTAVPVRRRMMRRRTMRRQ